MEGWLDPPPPSSIFATTQYLVKIYLKWIACYVVYKIMLISWENGAAGVSDVIEHVFFFLDFSLFPLQYLPCQSTKAIKLKSKIENKIKKINSNFTVLPFST